MPVDAEKELIRKYPKTAFSVLIDHPEPTKALSDTMAAAGLTVGVLMDLDVGQHRTGIPVGDGAMSLYVTAAKLPGLRPNGFQLYDGLKIHTGSDHDLK